MILPLAASLLLQEPITTPEARLEAWDRHRASEEEGHDPSRTWRALGPRFAGGRIEAVAVHPDSPQRIFAGIGAGGVWRSDDGGLSWSHVFADLPTFAVGDVAVAPSDPDVVWVGTGEAHLSSTSYAGLGVFRSIDGGETWSHVGLSGTQQIGKVVIHPEDPDHVWVAAIGHRHGPNAERGVYETIDGGETWEQVLFVNEETALIDLVMDRNDPETLFAAAWRRGGGGRSGLHRTRDGGETWEELDLGLGEGARPGRVAVDLCASRPEVVYALVVDHSRPGDGRGGVGGVLVRSDDGGDSWNKTHEEWVPTYVGWDFCDVRVAPDDPEEVYVCGLRLLRSGDGGRTLERTGETVLRLLPHQGKGMHLDMHELWIDPEHPEHLLLGTDGGLYSSWNRGESWLHLNTLPIAEFYRVSLHGEGEDYEVLGGTQDNASLRGPSTASVSEPDGADPWTHVFLDIWAGGDGFATHVDPFDEGIVYFEHQNGDMRRKRADGPVLSGRGDRRIRPRSAEGEPALRFAWDTPLFPSPHQEGRLYCAAQFVFRSEDRGDSWERVSPDLTVPGEGVRGRGSILDVSESRIDPERLWAGAGRGRVWTTSDGGESWTAVGEGLPRTAFRRVVASPHEVETAFVALSGRESGDFQAYAFRTDDGGKSWQSISDGLTESVNVLIEDPVRPGLLYAGTDLGVCASTDGGATWISLGATLPSSSVVDLAAHPAGAELVAVTHGLSAFVLDISSLR